MFFSAVWRRWSRFYEVSEGRRFRVTVVRLAVKVFGDDWISLGCVSVSPVIDACCCVNPMYLPGFRSRGIREEQNVQLVVV